MSILKIAFPGPVDTMTLHSELTALTLPSLGVVSRLSRKTDNAGKLVLGDDEKPVAVPPYVMIESDPLTPAQVTAARAAVAAHVPPAAPLPTITADQLARSLLDAGVKKGDGTALTIADLGSVRPPRARVP